LGLPPMPAKTSDPRFWAFAQSHGENAVELDAIPPDEFERIVRDAIRSLIDPTTWDAELNQANQEREAIQTQIDELIDKLD
ncbi:unnamed protein product, partial [marine sediment metagenome]